ncbi:hypothetical protein N7468_007532 [Penicillium chermesinum]|uniref:Auxin efflux carrier n=1 Tax=Penicillium chermesinum TaxID=63820 RepID=A0A9W9TKK7_9EURO|nr:uncharacterized protein N7468_007532 [Penicillium chermesinum]KAJ5226307.1 hypothetical protein N7468_007532 [Penicillium chermesinum]
MAILSAARSFQQNVFAQDTMAFGLTAADAAIQAKHPSFSRLLLLVFEAVLEVICVCLPGYIAARSGMFDAKAQRFVADLNVTLFTPCLIFIKLGSQLTAEKLSDLAIIPVIFVVQTAVSYSCSWAVTRCCGFKKRQSNFVTAMAVFGNSNSLPISLVISLSATIEGLHWDRIPGDNDDEVAARGILYLLIFQQLGQLVRWSWGYNVLLAPKDRYEDSSEEGDSQSAVEEGHAPYTDNPIEPGVDEPLISTRSFNEIQASDGSPNGSAFVSGDQTPVSTRQYAYSAKVGSSISPDDDQESEDHNSTIGPLPDAPFLPRTTTGDMLSFPDVETINRQPHEQKTIIQQWRASLRQAFRNIKRSFRKRSSALFARLPTKSQKFLSSTGSGLGRFSRGPCNISFFDEGTFVRNSVTRAVEQNAQVAVPLILVVLGANLARNTLPEETEAEMAHPRAERKLIIASLLSRMLLPTLVMAPFLALMAKFVPISILDDPIFIIVCFLLTGAPSALQLAQICQINDVYVGAMSKILFQSYVVWILPSTLALVVCALEVLEWASA